MEGTKEKTQVLLVAGEPGIGKSHLLARIRKNGEMRRNFLFVQVRPIGDYQRLFLHIYQETFISLRRKWPDFDYTPLDVMISHIIGDAILALLEKKHEGKSYTKPIEYLVETIKRDPLELYDYFKKRTKLLKSLEKQILRYLFDRDPTIDLTFWEVLLKTLYAKHRMTAIRWLQGDELSEEDLKKLGIPSSITDQDQALRILSTVFTLSPLPILLSFDQLESLHDRTGDEFVFRSFFDILVTLHGHTKNCVILLLIQSSVWDHLRNLIQKSAQDRVQEHFSLVSPTKNELKQIVERRMKSLWKNCPDDPPPYFSYPFSTNLIEQIGQDTGNNPRYVLQVFADQIDEMKEKGKINEPGATFTVSSEPIADSVVEEFLKARVDDFVANFSKNKESYPSGTIESFLRDVFRDLTNSLALVEELKQKPQIELIKSYSRPRDLDYIIKFKDSKNQKKNVGIQVTNTDNGRSFFSRIDNIQRKIHSKEIDKWVLIRNKSLPIKDTWKKSHEYIYSLSDSGQINLLDFDTIAILMVSKGLLDAAGAGDLSIGSRTLTRDEVLAYLANSIFIQNVEIIQLLNFSYDIKLPMRGLPRQLKEKKKPPKRVKKEDTKKLEEEILQILENQPILASKKIAVALKREHPQIHSILDVMASTGSLSIVQQTDDELYVMIKAEDVF